MSNQEYKPPETPRDAIIEVLTYTKAVQPQFSTVTDEMVDGWTERIQNLQLPLEVYLEAAKRFQSQHMNGEWLTVGWLIVEAKKVADDWRRDPVRRVAMLAYDAELLAIRDQMISSGQFAAVRGYRPPASLNREIERKPENVTSDARKRWRDIVGGFRNID